MTYGGRTIILVYSTDVVEEENVINLVFYGIRHRVTNA